MATKKRTAAKLGATVTVKESGQQGYITGLAVYLEAGTMYLVRTADAPDIKEVWVTRDQIEAAG